MRGVLRAAPTTAPNSVVDPCCGGGGGMDGLLVFVFYLSLPIRGARLRSSASSSNC
jgi:hypothetical protein